MRGNICMFIFALNNKQMRQENDVFWGNVQRAICKKVTGD